MPLRPMRKRRPIVHEWRQRITAAYSVSPEPLDDGLQHHLGRAQVERVRHFQTIAQLRAGLISGDLAPLAAARALTAEADACVQAMLQIAFDEIIHKRGAPPGRFAVLGMGKLGGGELTLSSDLDVIFVYEAGACGYDVAAADYFHRLAQRLIALLSWAPDWKESYEVDVRLRPHGEDGPLATPLTGLVDYLGQACWTWELQALTRLRPVAGDQDLADRVLAAARTGAGLRVDGDILDQVADMRALMDQERPGGDLWDVKLRPGGLVDIEFIVQALQLKRADQPGCGFEANTDAALAHLAESGVLRRRDASLLRSAWTLYSTVRQIQSAMACDDLGRLSTERKAALGQILGAPANVVRNRLIATQARVRGLFAQLIGPVRLSAAA